MLLSFVGPTQSILIANTAITAEAATIKINKPKASLVKGETLKLKISGTKSKVKWWSSKPKVASVTTKGIVKAKKKGLAKIKAKTNNKTYTCNIKVESPKLNRASLTLKTGNSYQLKLTGTKEKFSWSSSNGEIAAVSKNGNVTAMATGTCTVYATIRKIKYSCNVLVESHIPPDSVPGQDTEPNPGTETEPEEIAYVWLPATGRKYHKIPNCGNMNPNKATKVSLSEAISKGYDKCETCFN